MWIAMEYADGGDLFDKIGECSERSGGRREKRTGGYMRTDVIRE